MRRKPLFPKANSLLSRQGIATFNSAVLPYQIIDAVARKVLEPADAVLPLLEIQCKRYLQNKILIDYTSFQLIHPGNPVDEKRAIDLACKAARESCQFGPFVEWTNDLMTHLRRDLKPEDTHFLMVTPDYQSHPWDLLNDIMTAKTIPCFLENHSLGTHIFLIFPPKLWSALLTFHYKSQTIGQRIALGYSAKETFSDSTQRVMSVVLPEFDPRPLSIHGRNATSLESYLHDATHHLVDSSNPHRPEWVSLATHLKTLEVPEALSQKKEELSFYLLDRLFPEYLSITTPAPVAFWISLGEELAFIKDPDLIGHCLQFILNDPQYKAKKIDLSSLKATSETLVHNPQPTNPRRSTAQELLHFLLILEKKCKDLGKFES